MSQIPINVGTSPNDGTGDDLRTAFGKVNANFADVYSLNGNKQPLSSVLTGVAGVSFSADKLLYATGPSTFAAASLTGYARGLLGSTDAGTARTALGLGGAAVLSVGTTTGTVADGGALASETVRAQAAEATKAAKGANSDITSLAGLTTALSVSQGGTGGNTAATARSSLSAAASGTNSDITSLTGLTTPLSGNQGGTGYTSVSAALDALFSSTQGAILYRGPAAWLGLPPGTSGQVLTTGGTGANPSWQTAATSASTPPVRQTAYTGPRNTDGSPSFLPSTTTGTLTLTAQNVSSTVPLGITAAQGSGTTPNVSYSYTSNPAWALTASTTNYLFINASTGATSVQTLQPIYQYGGTPSTTNGQFTFDYAAMQGYLGNGTTAVATPLVAMGEAVTSSTAVTSTVAYAYNGYYDSGWTATLPSAAATTTKSHNLGVQPGIKRMLIETTTAEFGYAVGDQFDQTSIFSGNGSYGVPVSVTSTRNTMSITTANGTAFLSSNKINGTSNAMTLANYRWKFITGRGW